MSQASDVSVAIRPIHFLSILFLVSPYFTVETRQGRRNFKFNKYLFFINCIGLLFFLCRELCTFAFSVLKIQGYDDVEPMVIATFMMFIIYYASTIIFSNTLCNRVISFFNYLIEIDEKFAKLSLCPNDFLPKLVVYALTIFELISVSSIFVYSGIFGDVSFESALFIYRHTLSFVRMTIFSSFIAYTFLVYHRFKILNDQLMIYKALYKDASPELKKHIVFSTKICCSIHEMLTISSQMLNKAYGIQLATGFISTFWFIVPVLNLLLKETNIFTAFNFTMLNCIKTFVLLLCIFFIALTCSKTENKVCKSVLDALSFCTCVFFSDKLCVKSMLILGEKDGSFIDILGRGAVQKTRRRLCMLILAAY